MTDKTFYITTAISYPNGAPHIGHAYEALATDAMARFKRLDGYDVMFLTGTDEHGQKILQTAQKQGMAPGELAEQMTAQFIDMVAALNCSNDDFIRTTEPRHQKTVQALWKRMDDNGDIYLDKYAGWYSVRDEAYYNEDETELQGDTRISIKTQTPVEWVEEESYFFRLSAYGEKLLAHIEANPDFVGPAERRNEIVSFLKGGLNDLSISRTTFDWGVPVVGNKDHVTYVWLDALTNYMSATGYLNEDGSINTQGRARFWPADLHIIGKDIIRFHAIYWPAFLMSADLPLPKRVYAHGFLFNKGEKMSKSLGNVVSPASLIDSFGVDQIRFFFLREVPFGKDGNYSHEAIVNRINADLANDIGNLAQRSLSMIAKNCDGKVPDCGPLTAADNEILDAAKGLLDVVREHHDKQALHRALEAIWRVIGDANKYFAGQEPWALKKTDPQRMATVLYVTAELIRRFAILAQPYIPAGAGAMLDLLAVANDQRQFIHLDTPLASGVELPKPSGVFPRYVDQE